MEKWTAFYNDGSMLEQYNDDGSANTYRDIDRDKLVKFSLSAYGKTYTVSLEEGRRLIYRKRTRQIVGAGSYVVYLLGWQKNVRDENVQSLMFISKDEVVSAGRWGTGMFSEPQFYNFE